MSCVHQIPQLLRQLGQVSIHQNLELVTIAQWNTRFNEFVLSVGAHPNDSSEQDHT